MTEFTSEWIAGAREVVGNDDASPSGQIAFIALDHIEHLQKRVEEVEDNREHIERLLCDAEKRIAELEQEQRWIPVSNLPQKEEGECRLSIDVLLQPHPDASTLIAYYDFDDEKWIELQTAFGIKVSSQGIWHTLPQPPQESE